jgi:hypothetical protein
MPTAKKTSTNIAPADSSSCLLPVTVNETTVCHTYVARISMRSTGQRWLKCSPDRARQSRNASQAVLVTPSKSEDEVGRRKAVTAGQQGYERDPERVEQGGERRPRNCLVLDRGFALLTGLRDRQGNEQQPGQRSGDGDASEIEVCVAHERDDAGRGVTLAAG